MLLSVFIAQGFQHQIRTKVIGFGSHIQILPFLENAESGSEAMLMQQDFYSHYRQQPSIKSMHPVAYKPGILQRTRKNEKGNREIQGVLFKGINQDYDKEFLQEHLIKGKLLSFQTSKKGLKDDASRDILISAKIARNLSIDVNDTLSAVLISKRVDYSVAPDIRRFIVCGIYETGLEEFDNEYVFIDLKHIQRANGWGINVVLDVNDTIKDNKIKVGLNCITTAGKLNWTINGKPYGYGTVLLPALPGSKFEFIASDANGDLLSDTVEVLIAQETGNVMRDNGYSKKLQNGSAWCTVNVNGLKGSNGYYASGFEINLKTWEDLTSANSWLKQFIGPAFSAKTIVEQQPQIFNWLELVDVNVVIIIVLMLVVAIINLISAILVLILERSKMIGLLKSMGAENASIGKIFFYFTISILVRGLLIGNVLVLAVYFIQQGTGVLQLNPETYFVNTVPMHFSWFGYLLVNVITMVVCLLAFFIPVTLVSRINPVRAIKIE